jgi:hypothetical protein
VIVENLDWTEFAHRHDRPEVRQIFAGFEMEGVRLDYSIGTERSRPQRPS